MPNFFEDIWLSVFEPGTNKSLVLATHASFALLQATFLALFIGTRSVHFVFLSLICGGLWATITWFIGEVAAIQKAEELEKEREKKEKGEAGEKEGEKEEEKGEKKDK